MRASRHQAWQLKAADFIPAIVALPTQVEWTDVLLFLPLLVPRGMNLHIMEPESPVCSRITQPSWRCMLILHREQSWADESLAFSPAGHTPLSKSQGGPGWSSCFRSGSPVFLEIKQKSEFWSLLQHKELLLQKMMFFWVSHRVPRVYGKGVSMFTMQVNAGSGIGPQNESFPKSPPKALFLFSFSSLKT